MITDTDNLPIEENEEGSPAVDVLLPPRVVQRLTASIKTMEDVLDYESDMLEKYDNPDFADIHARKERAIHALNLICQENPQIGAVENKSFITQIIEPLQIKLVRNERILKIHLDAVGELVDLISSTAQARDTDGTYSPFAQV